MTELGTYIEQLDALPYAFHVAKGRTRKDEKLWAVALFREANGISDTDEIAFLIEGDDLRFCVTRCVAWHETQTAKEPAQ